MPSPPVHLYRHRADIRRPERVQQGTGFVEQETVVATGVRCRLNPVAISTTADTPQAAQLEYNATHSIFFVPDQDVKRDDICLINGEDFEIVGFVDDSDNATVYRKAFALQAQAGV